MRHSVNEMHVQQNRMAGYRLAYSYRVTGLQGPSKQLENQYTTPQPISDQQVTHTSIFSLGNSPSSITYIGDSSSTLMEPCSSWQYSTKDEDILFSILHVAKFALSHFIPTPTKLLLCILITAIRQQRQQLENQYTTPQPISDQQVTHTSIFSLGNSPTSITTVSRPAMRHKLSQRGL